MMSRKLFPHELGTAPAQLGIVPYANAWPLTRFVPEMLPGCRMMPYLPAQLQFRLISHHLDVALMPIVTLMELPTGVVLGDACIACRGPVESVSIFSKKPFGDIRTIAMDVSSRSSVLLAEVLFHEYYGSDPKKYQLPLGADIDILPTDAFLLIGDPALQFEMRPPWTYRFDLGELWQDHTGLPFVFAAWIACQRKGRNDRPIAAALSEARDQGIAHIVDIVAERAHELPISSERMRRYLGKSICYRIGSDERTAIDTFFELAMSHRLIPDRHQVTFLGD